MARLKRLLNMFRRGRLDREIEAELAFHIDMRAREYERDGMSPDDARREAVRRVGNPRALRDRTRDVDLFVLLETTWLDARYAARWLLRTPGFAVAAVLTLALGIGANTAMFAIVYGILLRPLPYPEADQLYTVFQTSESIGRTRAAPLDFLDWRERTSRVRWHGGAQWNRLHAVGRFGLGARHRPARLGRTVRRPGCATEARARISSI